MAIDIIVGGDVDVVLLESPVDVVCSVTPVDVVIGEGGPFGRPGPPGEPGPPAPPPDLSQVGSDIPDLSIFFANALL